MIVGGYTLHLYCDTKDCPNSRCELQGDTTIPPFVANDEHGYMCRSKARREGWRLNVFRGTCLCPDCAKKVDTNDCATTDSPGLTR